MAEERRSAHRVRIGGVRATYESVAGGTVEADVVDLGTGGVFVRTAAPLAVGKRISLDIQVIGEPAPWSAVGRVVWTRDKGEGEGAPPGMAVKFIDVDEQVVASIERLVETRERTEPGVGKPSSPPPAVAPVAPVVAVGAVGTAPERERTLMGVGIAPDEPPPSPPPAREQSVAIDLVAKKSVRPMPPPTPRQPSVADAEGGGSGRVVVVLLLLIVAGVAAYVLLDGFLRPPVH
jgi:uncharacterized protein (TIGR02266 family)